jgi:hypothetical protein
MRPYALIKSSETKMMKTCISVCVQSSSRKGCTCSTYWRSCSEMGLVSQKLLLKSFSCTPKTCRADWKIWSAPKYYRSSVVVRRTPRFARPFSSLPATAAAWQILRQHVDPSKHVHPREIHAQRKAYLWSCAREELRSCRGADGSWYLRQDWRANRSWRPREIRSTAAIFKDL